MHYRFPKRIVPFPQQIEVINDLAARQHQGYFLDMGCVDAETEYLSPTGWRRIDEYVGGPVAQFEPNSYDSVKGRVTLVEPLAYIKKPCDQMLRIQTSRGVDQKLSLDHRVVYADYAERRKETTAAEVFESHGRCTYGWKGRFITTFEFDGPGIDMSRAQLRLMVAVIADGHFPGATNRCIVRVKKARKIDRLHLLLSLADVAYEFEPEMWAGCEGFVRFTFNAPVRLKHFDERFYKATQEQLRMIAEECFLWDGHTPDADSRGARFFSSVKESADFIQFALVATGTRASVNAQFRQREERAVSLEYGVQEFKRSSLAYACGVSPAPDGMPLKTETMWLEEPSDGYQYCFTVPSSFLVLRRNGCIFVTGNCGKTFCATAVALYQRVQQGNRAVIIVPPLLIPQWGRWLREIEPRLSVVEYCGTPKQREALSLDADFVVVGIQIFKRDYQRFVSFYADLPVTVIADEATFLSNIGTDIHDKVFDFCVGRTQMLLTGTPANKPGDAYGILKFTAPGTYRNKRHFENLHVAERDYFNNPSQWQNLDLLADNLKINSRRLLYGDLYSDQDEPLYDPIEYALDKDHYDLYRELAEDQLLRLPDGGKIDATTVGRLTHALGQIVLNHDHFSGDDKATSAGLDLIAQKLDELGDGKLVVFANYRMTVAQIVKRFYYVDARAINSEVSAAQKQRNLEAFIDGNCRLIVIQFISGGKGLDGLQNVCHHCLFIEPCQQPRDFHQAVARLRRMGQRYRVWVGMAIAQRTLQVRGFNNLLANDTLMNQVVRNEVNLRAAIFGG